MQYHRRLPVAPNGKGQQRVIKTRTLWQRHSCNAPPQFHIHFMGRGKRFKHLDNLFTYLSDLEKTVNCEDYLHSRYYYTLKNL